MRSEQTDIKQRKQRLQLLLIDFINKIMFELFLDSSQRIASSSTTRASFLLNRDLIRIKSVSVISASFSDLTYNINELNNLASFGTMPPKYYTSSDFVATVNTLLGSGGSVTFDSATNLLTWSLSTAIQTGSLSDILGLSPLLAYNGSFTSQLVLLDLLVFPSFVPVSNRSHAMHMLAA
jgi:fumarate reductase subunit D